MTPFLSTAWAQAQTQGQTQAAATPAPSGLGAYLNSPMVLMLPLFLIFYMLIFRPQQKQQKERRKMLSELKKGDSVLTNAGIYGKIVEVNEQTILVEIANNVKIKLVREGIAGFAPVESKS